jgi:hypothetical protein
LIAELERLAGRDEKVRDVIDEIGRKGEAGARG